MEKLWRRMPSPDGASRHGLPRVPRALGPRLEDQEQRSEVCRVQGVSGASVCVRLSARQGWVKVTPPGRSRTQMLFTALPATDAP
jgi:hypothetical protein